MLVHFYQAIDTLKASPARRDKLVVVTSVVALIINLALWVFMGFQLQRIVAANPEVTTIPLHYNVFLGIDLFGKWWKALYLPLIGLGVVIVNFVLAFLFYSKKTMASYFLSLTSLVVQIAMAVAGVLIVLINL